MKGIILAGGKGTRLGILTLQTNKHLCPVFDKQMILYPLQTLKDMGIKDIMIVSGKDHYGKFVEFLGSGNDFGVDFTYKVQDDAGGIAQALGLAKDFINGQNMVVILGDNYFEYTIDISMFETKKHLAGLVLKYVPNPERFGVYSYNPPKIEEKPKKPKSNLAVTGLYIYPADVFDVIKTLKPSERGELEITDVNNFYIEEGRVATTEFSGFWSDMGTPESLAITTKFLMDKNGK